MATYVVNHRYTAHRDGTKFGPYEPDTRVELEGADAEWVNRDSPGTLTPVSALAEPEPVPVAEPEPASVKPPVANRQHKGGRNRAGG